MSEKKVIAFSSADTYIGETLSRYTATNSLHDFQKIHGLVKNESIGEELKKVGIEPHVVDYEKPETLEKALQGVHCLVFVIGDDEKRVHEAEKLIEAVKKAKVCGVLLISCAATENGEGKRLREYKEIEEKVAKIELHHILRVTWPYQLFFLWTRMIQNEGKLRLAVAKDSKFAPIDIRDVGKAVHKFLTWKKEDGSGTSKHAKYVLTGPETIKAEQVVEKLNSTVQANVGFEETTKEKLKQYLESLRSPHETHKHEDFVPRPCQLTDVVIEVMLEAQDLIKQGKGTAKTDDLKEIIGKEGEKLEVFFKDHQQYFKPRG